MTYDSALTLISVEREPTSEGNKFTVRYTKNAEDLIFRVQDNMGAPRCESIGGDLSTLNASYTCHDVAQHKIVVYSIRITKDHARADF